MAEQDQPINGDADMQEKRLAGRVRFYAVVYRIVLIAGLLLLIAAVALLLVTDLFSAWILLLPAALIALGIILARVEYHLDVRLYNLRNQASTDGKNSPV